MPLVVGMAVIGDLIFCYFCYYSILFYFEKRLALLVVGVAVIGYLIFYFCYYSILFYFEKRLVPLVVGVAVIGAIIGYWWQLLVSWGGFGKENCCRIGGRGGSYWCNPRQTSENKAAGQW